MSVSSSNHRILLLSLIGAAFLTSQSSAFGNQPHKEIRKLTKNKKKEDGPPHLSPSEMAASPLTSGKAVVNRALEVGDFELFNELFRDAQIELLESATLEANGGLATLNIENLVCTDFDVGDLQTTYEILQESGNDVLAYTIKAQPFAMRCSADYSIKLFGLNAGDGRFTAPTSGNMVEARIDLTSPSFALGPPTIADVEFCNAEIIVDGDIDFEGNALDQVFEFFSDPIENLVKTEASKGTVARAAFSLCHVLCAATHARALVCCCSCL